MKFNRSVSLDIIRIFACLCILIIHFNASVSGWDLYNSFKFPNHLIPNNVLGGVYLGDLGVGIFFILSGACLQFTSRFVGKLTAQGCFKFWKKRAYSIYPAFWIAFVFATAIHFIWYKGMSMSGWKSFLASLLGLDGYLGFMIGKGGGFYQVGEWFLGCIIIIYLLYPVLSYLFEKFPTLLTIVIFSGYFCLIPYMSKHWFFLVLPYFLSGMIFSRYLFNYKSTVLLGITLFLLIVRLVWGDRIIGPNITLITSWVVFVLVFVVSEFIEKEFDGAITENIRKSIERMSILTYPAFLIHHKLISLLAPLFNLSEFPYRYTVMLFIIYMSIIYILSVVLDRTSKSLGQKLFVN